MQIDITNACNLSCRHCYHSHHKNFGSLNFEQWKSILIEYDEIISEIGASPHIIICGGEPLLSPMISEIINYIGSLKKEYHVSILTNATLIHKYNLDLFKKIENIEFQVSLDGPNQEIHDSFRGVGNFQQAIHGIQKLIDNDFDVTILSTLTKKNSLLIKDFFEMAKKLKIPNISFTRLILEGQALVSKAKMLDDDLSPLELKAAYEKIIYYSGFYEVETNTNLPLMNLIYPLFGKRQRFEEGIVIDYKGNFLVSSRSRQKLGSVPEIGLKKLFFDNPFRNELRKLSNFECSSCSHFEFCGGDRNASYAYTNSFFKKDPLCWKTTTVGEIA